LKVLIQLLLLLLPLLSLLPSLLRLPSLLLSLRLLLPSPLLPFLLPFPATLGSFASVPRGLSLRTPLDRCETEPLIMRERKEK
jgi:hypothetical protein